MLVKDLLKDIKIRNVSTLSILEASVTDISFDSRYLKDNSAFFAFKGTAFDTHQVLAEIAKSDKINCIICEYEIEGIDCILVENSREALSIAASNLFETKNCDLKKIAVTGTNGKTTITYIIDEILNSAEMNSIRIGTTEYKVVNEIFPANNTTPGPYELNSLIRKGLDSDAEVLVMEVSSHALHQNRVSGVLFDVGVFTNLTGDHLDYHGTMDSYYEDKKKLFQKELCKKAVINIDSDYGKKLITEIEIGIVTCSINSKADICIIKVEYSLNGIIAKISIFGNIYEIKTKLTGSHNLSNILCAIGAAKVIGIPDIKIIDGINRVENVPGRLEKIENDGVFFFIDYAHTDDALDNVLNALSLLKKAKVITVFGCGGDRDKSKRPRMAAVAEKMSDVVIVTSDNPRTEDPDEIIKDILKGFNKPKSVLVEPDRRKAIEQAFKLAVAGDIVLIAGKGHEDYQILGTEKIHFDDREEIIKLTGVSNENC